LIGGAARSLRGARTGDISLVSANLQAASSILSGFDLLDENASVF
jgi:hypothetical protein